MSIGHRRFPDTEPSREQVHGIITEQVKVQKLLDLTKHEGWEVLNEELTRRELDAMRQLATGSTEPDIIAFYRAMAQICRHFREMPERLEQQRETLQLELDLVAPKE